MVKKMWRKEVKLSLLNVQWRRIMQGAVVLSGLSVNAQNPIVQTAYTADPAPLVYNDKLYLYTSHDEDDSTWFTMNDWKLYSTDDMVNWTEHPTPLSFKTFEWARGDAWAAQCIERDGKFYMYVPVTDRKGESAIGVAVADSPYGPFYDPLGTPLVQADFGNIDPTVFIDDDGQAYLYWGNPNCFYVKLNKDMISYEGEIHAVPMKPESFGRREGNPKRATLYEEAPWLYKRKGAYYLFYAGGPIPEHLAYATSDSPEGPWKYGGTVMAKEGGSFTNHPGIVDFRGKTYLFYHDASLPGGSGFTRSVCVREMDFGRDGKVNPVKMVKEGVEKGLKPLCPYRKVEAETMAWSKRMKSDYNPQVGVFVTALRNGSYTRVRDVDFGEKAPSRILARLSTTHNADIVMEVRLDGLEGQVLAELKVPRTGGSDRWKLVEKQIPQVTGVHDLYFIFKEKAMRNLAYFDYWKLSH